MTRVLQMSSTCLSMGELGADLGVAGGDAGLEEAVQEGKGGGHGQVEAQRVQHDLLHLQDLLPRVRLVADEHKILDLWSPDLLILASHKHCSHAHLPSRKQFKMRCIPLDTGVCFTVYRDLTQEFEPVCMQTDEAAIHMAGIAVCGVIRRAM